MISLESQVLERHLSFFDGKSVLFAGGISDNFPQTLVSKCQSIQIWSCYFDYARTQSAVNFSVEFQDQADLLFFFCNKNNKDVIFQRLQLLDQGPLGQEILIIGENRCGVRSVEKTLEPYGEIAKIDSARRCGLYHFSLQNKPHFELKNFWKTYQHPTLQDVTIYSLPGVFSAAELDTGTELLLSTIDNKIKGKVLDLGCGAGVIGSMIKKRSPNAQITMTDIHAMALESARKTLSENQLQGEVYASDVFSDIEGKFDLIISNPPFHDGIDTAYRAVTELITQAKWHLNQAGELRIVANAFLPYPELLRQHFGDYEVVAQTGKFKVYSVRN